MASSATTTTTTTTATTTTTDDSLARLRRALLIGTLGGVVGITGIVALADGGPAAETASGDDASRVERVRTRSS